MIEKTAEPTTTKMKKPRSTGFTGAASSRFYSQGKEGKGE